MQKLNYKNCHLKNIDQQDPYEISKFEKQIKKLSYTIQDETLKKYKLLPDYKLISNTGPRHSPSFTVAVKLKGSKFVHGEGSSKKNAEQNAAEKFLSSYTKNELAR